MLSDSQREFLRNPEEYEQENTDAAVRNMRKRIREKVSKTPDDLFLLQKNREVWADQDFADPELRIDPDSTEEKSQLQIFREIHHKLTRQIVDEIINQSYKPLFNTDTPIGRRLNLKTYGMMANSPQFEAPSVKSVTPPAELRKQADSIKSKYDISEQSEEIGTVQEVVAGLLPHVNQNIDWKSIRDTYDPNPENRTLKITLVTQSGEPVERFCLVIDETPQIVVDGEASIEVPIQGEIVGYQYAALDMFSPDEEYRPYDAYGQEGTMILLSPEDRSRNLDWMIWSTLLGEFNNLSDEGEGEGLG